MKKCTKCGETKPLAEFYVDTHGAGGLAACCRVCHKAATKARYAADPQVRERQKLCARRWVDANPVRRREIYKAHNWLKQGIDPAAAAAALRGHDGQCALCGADSPGTRQGWNIDHCHVTGKVRGVLCHGCNIGLGGFRDDPSRLREAAAYVERHAEVA